MNVLAAPNSPRDVVALQANIGQQTVIQLAQLLFSMVTGQVSLERTHQAWCGGQTVVANGLAAHADRRHFSSSFSRKWFQAPCLSHNLCNAPSTRADMRLDASEQTLLRKQRYAFYAYLCSYSLNNSKSHPCDRNVIKRYFCDKFLTILTQSRNPLHVEF
jgi:hypothetical protein